MYRWVGISLILGLQSFGIEDPLRHCRFADLAGKEVPALPITTEPSNALIAQRTKFYIQQAFHIHDELAKKFPGKEKGTIDADELLRYLLKRGGPLDHIPEAKRARFSSYFTAMDGKGVIPRRDLQGNWASVELVGIAYAEAKSGMLDLNQDREMVEFQSIFSKIE